MNRKNIKSMKGFTLLELIVVIAIIAILAVIAIPSFTKSIKTARINAIKADITNLRKAMEIYYYNNGGRYSTLSGGDVQGECLGPWKDSSSSLLSISSGQIVFTDPQVNKILTSLKNKLYSGGSWASNYNSFGNIFYCGVGNQTFSTRAKSGTFQNYVVVLWNVDNNGLGVCFDATGFYDGKPYASLTGWFTNWPSVCDTNAVSESFTFFKD